mmetsp:Transcript_1841/g.5201  ORF Transcript_1841/g.5201 Transcript_1841/m.5201 type:complete len:210 (-) Transcript_1841:555-1184(-)
MHPSVLSMAMLPTLPMGCSWMDLQLTVSTVETTSWKITPTFLQLSTTIVFTLPLICTTLSVLPVIKTAWFVLGASITISLFCTCPSTSHLPATMPVVPTLGPCLACFFGAALTTPVLSLRFLDFMSAVTFFRPEVTAPPLLSSAKRAALLPPAAPPEGLASWSDPGGGGGGAAGGPPLVGPLPPAAALKVFASAPLAFQAGPVGWCALT